MERIFYLVPVQLTTGNFSFTLLLESKDDQRYKDVEKEKWEHHNEANVIKSITRAVVRYRAFICFCCGHGGLHSTVERKRKKKQVTVLVQLYTACFLGSLINQRLLTLGYLTLLKILFLFLVILRSPNAYIKVLSRHFHDPSRPANNLYSTRPVPYLVTYRNHEPHIFCTIHWPSARNENFPRDFGFSQESWNRAVHVGNSFYSLPESLQIWLSINLTGMIINITRTWANLHQWTKCTELTSL